jgi:hypothetical protein
MKSMPDVMDMLEHGVPLTLLIDLLGEQGPASMTLYRTEPADTTWVKRSAAA